MKRRRIAVFAALILVASGAGSGLLLERVDESRAHATLNEAVYISSPKLLKRLSLGYDGLLADVYWTRVVQYYGGKHHAGGGRYELLWPLLNITSQLDPHIIPVYEFGGTFLFAPPPNGAGLPERAIELVEYGISNNPDDWHLYYDLGYLYYDLKDYPGAANAFERGSRVPNAHPFLKILAAQAAQHGGEAQTAQMLWGAIYQTTKDNYIRENALWHLRALRADQDCVELTPSSKSIAKARDTSPAASPTSRAAGCCAASPLTPLEMNTDSTIKGMCS